MDQPLLVKGSILTQCTIELASNTSVYNVSGDGSTEMTLIEERHDFVSGLETGYACADGFNCAGSVGGWDNAVFDREGVFALQMS